MALLTKESSAAWTALAYITVGALCIVWTTVFFAYEWHLHGSEGHVSYYWCGGFLATGVTLLVIGFLLGHIGRAARAAELPPHEATAMVAQTEQAEAVRTQGMLPGAPVAMQQAGGQPQMVVVPMPQQAIPAGAPVANQVPGAR